MWCLFVLLMCLGVMECGLFNSKILNRGRWVVLSLEECPNPEQYPLDINLSRRKINRTNDAFSLRMDLPEVITETSHGIYLDACKKLDGGCKQVQTFDEPSFCQFAKKYAEKNFFDLLKRVGVEDCPIPAGLAEVDDFVINYEELPETGLVGEFTVSVFLVKDDVRLVCIMLDALFDEIDDDDDDEWE